MAKVGKDLGNEQTCDKLSHMQSAQLVSAGLHATGNCRMGLPADSVLDSRLRVHGIQGLRVADCSAMPTPPSGNTNGPAMMLDYRASEVIREDGDRKE